MSDSLTVRISKKSHRLLRQLGEASGQSMLTVLDEALKAYRKKQLFDEANAAYEALRSDPKEWALYEQEIEDWDGTLLDGLEETPDAAPYA